MWRWGMLLTLLWTSVPAWSQTAYRCTDKGRVTFQQTPCPATSTQQAITTAAPQAADTPPQEVSCDQPPKPGQRIVRMVGPGMAASNATIIGESQGGQAATSPTVPSARRCMAVPDGTARPASPTPRLTYGPTTAPGGAVPPPALAPAPAPPRPVAQAPKKPLPTDESALIALLPAGFPDAEQAARELGKRDSIPGLQAIIQRRDAKLVGNYAYGRQEIWMREFGRERAPLPASIEKIVLQNMEDPVVGKPLLMLARAQPYRTREMFDALMKHIADKDKVDANTRWPSLVVNTSLPGIEGPLLEAVPRLDSDGQMSVLRFLADPRRYNPAVPAIARWLAQAPPGQESEGYRWLQKIGTPEAVNAMAARLPAYAPPLDDARRRGEVALLNALAQLPRGSVKGVAAKVPHKDDADVARAYVYLLQTQPDPGAAKELLAYLDQEKLRQGALEAILATDSADLWQAARAKYTALQPSIDPGSYQFAMGQLNRRLDRPDDFRREQSEMRQRAAFSEEKDALLKPYYYLQRTQQQDPKEYVRLAREKIAALEKLAARYPGERAVEGLRGDIQQERTRLAATQRFRLRQPQDAIATLAGSDPDAGGGMSLIWIADAYRFDLGDKARAIEHYRKALGAIEAGARKDRQAEGIAKWMRRWIGHEIAYLETGKSFQGPVTREDMGGMVLMLLGYGAVDMPQEAASIIGGGMPPEGKSREQALRDAVKAFEAQPPSQIHLGLVMQLAPGFASGDALVAFLERRDPARFVSAGLLAGVEMMAQPGASGGEFAAALPVLKAASAAYGKRTGIRFKTAANPLFASPEATWRAYLAAMRRGDRGAALACFTPGQLKSSLEGLFTRMSNEELKKMADDFSEIAPSEGRAASPDDVFREYAIVRKSSRQAGFITFVNAAGEWLIQSM